MELEAFDKGKGKSRLPSVVLIGVVILLALVGWGLSLFSEMEKPQVTPSGDLSRVGQNREVVLTLADAKRGLRSLKVTMLQEGKAVALLAKEYPRQGNLLSSGPHRLEERLTINAATAGFKEGAAELLIEVRDHSWWGLTGNLTALRLPVTIDTKPPVVSIVSLPQHIKTGSAGIVVYRVNEPVTQSGVTINGHYHPGFPLPSQGEGAYGAMIGLPYDLQQFEETVVTAMDQAGNTGKAAFTLALKPGRVTKDRITISDDFLNAKLPEFAQHYPELKGTPVEQYLMVNGEIRDRNYKTVQEICKKSGPQRLWDGAFQRMAGSPKAGFADVRSYLYQGNEIDTQTHLGVDIASLEHAEIPADNRGAVVFAEYLGIYGNTVILDHGQGIFTLYSHLSQINATKGATVEKGATVGLTGTTGMAGGDHLHFSVLVNGIFVSPIEWWDAHWLQDNLLHVM
ncbi:MAG TPA: M23 family metallopeptidase [Desulfurivibrionaceae bacterium]|nr:M23 family metallopeptidase [Desulfurivibrionaceae bacterium]